MKTLGKMVLAGAAGVAGYALIKRLRRRDLAGYFEGKGVVVTGGASGIGLCLVDLLDLCGARVLAVDMDGEALHALRESLPDIETLEMDLAAPGAPAEMVRVATETLGRIDVCFSNAGIIWAAPFLSMTEQDIERLIAVNFQMQVLLTKELLPVLLDQGGGVIAYTGSLSSYVHSPMHSVYTGTKGGLNNFVLAVRRELPSDSNVQLSIIHPNMTRTGLVAEDLFEEISRRSFQLQTAEQVASAFLQGVANGDRQIFVEIPDYLYIWMERLAPGVLTSLFRAVITVDLQQMAEDLVEDSKIRRHMLEEA